LTAILDHTGTPMSRPSAAPTRERQLDAAGHGSRWQRAPYLQNFASEAVQGGQIIRSRARYFARNNPNISAAVDALVANIVGTGIRPQPRHSDEATRQRLSEAWEDWQEQADVTGQHDFYGLQALTVRQMIEAGEGLLRFLVRDGELHLQHVAADQLPFDDHRRVEGGTVRAGVEVDADGAPRAYHLHPARILDFMEPVQTRRIPAADVLHVFRQLEPGQPRGVTWLLPILLTMLDLDQFEDATLVRQKVAAMAAGAVVDVQGEQTGVSGTTDGGFADAEWAPGMLFRLDPGQDIRWFNPPDTGDHGEFVKHKLRMIGVGIGATYELISGDYSEHNYSSLRASYIELRRRIRQIQQGVLAHQMLRPTWRRFVGHLVLRGELDAADVRANPRQYGADWLPPRFEAADPQKDVEAELAEIRAGLKSRSQAARERGIAVEELDRQIAEDVARERRLGIAPDASPSPAPAQGASQ